MSRTKEVIKEDIKRLTGFLTTSVAIERQSTIARKGIEGDIAGLNKELAALNEPPKVRLYEGMNVLVGYCIGADPYKRVLGAIRDGLFFDTNGMPWDKCIPDSDADNWVEWHGGKCPIDWTDYNGIHGVALVSVDGIESYADSLWDWNQHKNIARYLINRKPEYFS